MRAMLRPVCERRYYRRLAELQAFDYDAVTAPTLLLRGAESDLLAPDIAEEMTRRGPRCRLEVIAGCGHAPALNTQTQYALIEAFLAS